MKIICPEKTYEQALIECGMETLENRREKMCIKLINDMKGLIHKLNELFPPTVGHVRERDTRLKVIQISCNIIFDLYIDYCNKQFVTIYFVNHIVI